MGYIIVGIKEVRAGHYDNILERCDCKRQEDNMRRSQFLVAMDGLTDRERACRFSNIQDRYTPDTLPKLRQATLEHRGLITLTGNFGVGKTTLLTCAVNEGRDHDLLVIYTTVSDLLSYLRSTFGPETEVSFDRYWDALIRCDILALDELDEFKTSEWAMERFLRLMDERWRRMDEVLTLCALNGRIQSLPGKVQSRLRDGRAQVINITGEDMRPFNSWN